MPFAWIPSPQRPVPPEPIVIPSTAVSSKVDAVANTVNVGGSLLYNTAAAVYDVVYPSNGSSSLSSTNTFATINVTFANLTHATLGTLNASSGNITTLTGNTAVFNTITTITLSANNANITNLYSPTIFTGTVSADPTTDLGIADKHYVDSLVYTRTPGEIVRFSQNTTPNGFIRAIPQNLSRTTYANLFSNVSITYGSGDGSTTFGCPVDYPPLCQLPDTAAAAILRLPTTLASFSTTYLSDGRILVIGGSDQSSITHSSTYFGTISGNSVTWVAGSDFPTRISAHTTTLLGDGRIVVVGGVDTANAGVFNISGSRFGTISGDSISWTSATITGSNIAVSSHTTSLMSDGRLLVTGGVSGGISSVGVALTYHGTIVGTGISWAAGTQMPGSGGFPADRFGHSAQTLSDGRVLVLGGKTSSPAYITNTAIFGTISGNTITWANGTNMLVQKYTHASMPLADGRIITMGGGNGAVFSAIPTCEFGTISGTTISWVAGTNYPDARGYVGMVQHSDARIFCMGGQTTTIRDDVYIGTIATNTITWLPLKRSQATVTSLRDGRLLLIGGDPGGSNPSSEVYFGMRSSLGVDWTPGTNMPAPRRGHTTTLLPDNRVLVIAGYNDNASGAQNTTWFGTISGTGITWDTGTVLPTLTSLHAATLLDDGRVMVIGGFNNSAATALVYFGVISGTSITWSTGTALPLVRYGLGATKLLDGRVLVIGGNDAVGGGRAQTYFGTITTNVTNSTAVVWTSGTDYPSTIYGFGLVLLDDGRIFASGGINLSTVVQTASYFGTISKNNILWTQSLFLPEARWYPAASRTADNTEILIMGGYDASLNTSTSSVAGNTYFPKMFLSAVKT